MNKAFSPPPARSDGRELRASAHLGHRSPIELSPELLAGMALLALTSVNVIGPLGILIFFSGTGAVLAFRPAYNLRQLVYFSPLLLLPLLAMISTIWSMAPSNSMKAGLELFITVVATILICRNLRPERMILILFVAHLALMSMALPYMAGAIASKTALAIPMFGSKNQTGNLGFMVFILALAMVADRNQPVLLRLVALGSIPVALAVGWLAQSGGTTSSIVLALLLFPPLVLLAAFKLPVRLVLIAIALVMVLIAAFFLDDIVKAINEFRTNVLNKDATLTGRTYLWDFAARMSASRPWLGYGYVAFWRRGNIDAEGLWRWGGIASRGGFNFHNAFVEMQVDLGLIGVSLLILTCAVVAIVAIVRQVAKPSIPLACLFSITIISYVRSYVENGLFSPFSLATVTWFATLLYCFSITPGGSIRLTASSDRQPAAEAARRAARTPRSTRSGPRSGSRAGVSLRTRY